jgi:hypothetical protein
MFYCYCFLSCYLNLKFLTYDNSVNIDAKNVILLPLDFSHQGKFNESKFIKISITGSLKNRGVYNTKI